MKLRKLHLLLCLCFLSADAFPQFSDIDIRAGAPYSYDDVKKLCGERGTLYLDSDYNLIDIGTSLAGDFGTAAFDAKALGLKASKVLERKFSPGTYTSPDIIQAADRLYCVVRYRGKTTKIVVYEIDLKTGDLKGDGKVVMEDAADFYGGLTLGMDKKSLVLSYMFKEYFKRDKEKYWKSGYVFLDHDLNKVTTHELTLSKEDRSNFVISGFTFDSKNNIYELNEFKDRAGTTYEMYVLKPDSKAFEAIPLKIAAEHELMNISYYENKGEIGIYAYTRRNWNFKRHSNLCLIKLDPLALSAVTVIDTPLDVYEENIKMADQLGLKGVDRWHYLIDCEFRSHDIIFLSDGSKIIVGAGYIYLPEQNTNVPQSKGHEYSMIVSCISPAGEMKWTKYTDGSNEDPVNYILDKDGLYFLYSYVDRARSNGSKSGDMAAPWYNVRLSKIFFDGTQVQKEIQFNKKLLTVVSDGKVILGKVKNPDTQEYQMVHISLKQ